MRSMDMDIMVVGTLTQLSIVPEVQAFFGDGGGGVHKKNKKRVKLGILKLFRFVGYWKKYVIY